jgi:hypothetical protein
MQGGIMKVTVTLIALLLGVNVFAGTNHEHMMAPKVSPQFESMKTLVGTWEGKNNMGGKEQVMQVTYALSSGGTVLVEKLMPGTPQEMMTVYANRGDQVAVTHYCIMGNQPEMKLKKADAGSFVFEMEGMKGISDKNELHMHAVTLTVAGDKLKQEWTNYKDNKKGDVAVFEFTKKK